MKRAAVLFGGAVIVVVALIVALAPSRHTTYDTDPTAFVLPGLSGGTVKLADFRGEPVVVNLFASWCAECEVELPAFARAAHRLKGKVHFIGVDSMETGDGGAMAHRYDLAANGFILAKDAGRAGSGLHDALRAPGMPVTVLYDASGHLLTKDIASLPEATLTGQLKQYFGV